ncbi:MAG TPA: MFS transporter [Gemmatales bacterium]|nr:MFS transporter [Gemmatales bacterium]HMP58178.1 MFS transporter [Gemmatales bacterium]
MSTPSVAPARRLSVVDWLIVSLAALGFAFDIYELLMLQFVLRPAVVELVGVDLGHPDFNYWRQMLFFLPMLMGGFFGLVGGYLTDYLGRRRMLTFSILLYAFSAFFAGFSTNIYQLLVWRSLTLVGVCIEFVAAVAWLAELFPNPRQREQVLGYTQAFSSVGGLLAAAVFGILVSVAATLPAVQIPVILQGLVGTISEAGSHAPWRYMLMSGVVPALPLILIRPFLPESPTWLKKKQEGTLRRPSVLQLFSPELRRTTIVTTLMVACGYGVALGCIQQVPQMLSATDPETKQRIYGMPEVGQSVQDAQAELAARIAEVEKSDRPAADKERELNRLRTQLRATPQLVPQGLSSTAGKIQEAGGLAGRFMLAYLAVIVTTRRRLHWCFVMPGLIVAPLAFAYGATTSLNLLYIGIFLVGFFTVAQFSFWGNYLPLVYPLHLRGTGESFAANVGGRILGTSAVMGTTFIEGLMPLDLPPTTRLAYAAAIVAGTLYILNFMLSFFLPEPGDGMTAHD